MCQKMIFLETGTNVEKGVEQQNNLAKPHWKHINLINKAFCYVATYDSGAMNTRVFVKQLVYKYQATLRARSSSKKQQYKINRW